MNATGAIGLIMYILGMGTMWRIQEWRIDAKEKDYVEQKLVDQQQNSKAALRERDAVITATNDGEDRARGLRVDATATRNELDRLRSSTARTVRDARASLDACVVRADTLGELFTTVASAGGELAEKAGRHTNDVQVITAAWPTASTKE